MKSGRHQAKDVPEGAIMSVLRARPGEWHTHWGGLGGMPSLVDLAPELATVPEKVLLAKLRRMAARGLIEGCGCGCRGDWHVKPPPSDFERALAMGARIESVKATVDLESQALTTTVTLSYAPTVTLAQAPAKPEAPAD